MGFLTTRLHIISTYLLERWRYGVPEQSGTVSDDVIFVVDGVGGFQFSPVLVRRALRLEKLPVATVTYRWQYGLVGEIWTDLMWYRRNRVMGASLARRMLAFRRAHPGVRIHLLAYSGGTGIGVFACEALGGRPVIDTLILACPALAPTYNLGPALRAVQRCFALVSARDRYLLGVGTVLFGTVDRKHCAAAGMRGFHPPTGATAEDRAAYERLREIRWSPELHRFAHHGGHTGWLTVPMLRRHIIPLLWGEARLPVYRVEPETVRAEEQAVGPVQLVGAADHAQTRQHDAAGQSGVADGPSEA